MRGVPGVPRRAWAKGLQDQELPVPRIPCTGMCESRRVPVHAGQGQRGRVAQSPFPRVPLRARTRQAWHGRCPYESCLWLHGIQGHAASGAWPKKGSRTGPALRRKRSCKRGRVRGPAWGHGSSIWAQEQQRRRQLVVAVGGRVGRGGAAAGPQGMQQAARRAQGMHGRVAATEGSARVISRGGVHAPPCPARRNRCGRGRGRSRPSPRGRGPP